MIPEGLTEYADGDILAGVKGAVGHIVINTPQRRNAMSKAMFTAGGQVAREMAENPAVRLLVVEGAGGKAFASGADISKFEQERSTPEQVAEYSKRTDEFYSGIYDFPKPTIAKIRGVCVGGGLALAVCCDLRICEEASRFAVPAGKLGLGYGFDGVKKLADIVGVSRAKEIFFTARLFSSQEAYDMGLVNKALPPQLLDAFVDDYAKRISENAPMTLAQIKAIGQDINKDPDDRDLARLQAMVDACFNSEDYKEGRRAFMEKRKPNFRGM